MALLKLRYLYSDIQVQEGKVVAAQIKKALKGVEVHFHAFLISTQDGGNSSLSWPATLALVKVGRYPLNTRLRGPQCRSGCLGEEFRTTVSPSSSPSLIHCTYHGKCKLKLWYFINDVTVFKLKIQAYFSPALWISLILPKQTDGSWKLRSTVACQSTRLASCPRYVYWIKIPPKILQKYWWPVTPKHEIS